MTNSFLQIILVLIAGIAVIILLTAKYRIHAFFALVITCFIVGAGVHMPFPQILNSMKEGFGRIMQSLGLIIVLGTTLGVLLEHSGCTRVMANYLMKKTGEKKAPLAMSITGFIVGLPVFCDSGFIVLNGLKQSLAFKTGISVVIMSVSLATGLYAVHCLVPPHPGASAAAATIGVDFGTFILAGTAVAIPGMIAGLLWSLYIGKKLPQVLAEHEHIESRAVLPQVLPAFLPVLIPIFLIALNSFWSLEKKGAGYFGNILSVAGEPVIALCIGIALVFVAGKNWKQSAISSLLQESAEKAGGILVIIGAGGAFGAILAAAKIGDHFSQAINLQTMGIFFPFLLTCLLKTAQGSSTVAIITASSIVLPLLSSLHLDSSAGKLLCVLSMGAGSMMISHANDAYFWVIAKFSGLDMKTMLKSYTVSTIIMGLITLLVVYFLSLIIL